MTPAEVEAALARGGPPALELRKVIQLAVPVTVGKDTYTELEVCEPTMGQLRKSTGTPGSSLDKLAALIALNAKVLPAVVDALCQRDVNQLDDFFASFASA